MSKEPETTHKSRTLGVSFDESELHPIIVAIAYGDYEKLKALSESNEIISYRNELGNTALHTAAIFDRIDFTELLLSLGADLNANYYGDRTLLHTGAQSNSIEIVSKLIELGMDVNRSDDSGEVPLP